MDLSISFLTIFTIEGFLKIYDISEDEPRLITGVRSLYDMCPDFGEIIQAKINSTASKVALTLAASNLIPDGRLYVWDIEQDKVNTYNFRKAPMSGKTEETYGEDNLIEEDDAEYDDSRQLNNRVCSNRIPLSLFWDVEDPRLLVCNAKRIKSSKEKTKFSKYFKAAAPTNKSKLNFIFPRRRMPISN